MSSYGQNQTGAYGTWYRSVTHNYHGEDYSALNNFEAAGVDVKYTFEAIASIKVDMNALYNEIGLGEGDSQSMLPVAGFMIGAGEKATFSKELGTWMGKDLKIRSQSWGGNGTTGGKFKFSGKVSTGFKVGGYLLGAYNAFSIWDEYSGDTNSAQLWIQQTSNAITTFGGIYGMAWGVGWELGADYGPSTWYGNDDTRWFR